MASELVSPRSSSRSGLEVRARNNKWCLPPVLRGLSTTKSMLYGCRPNLPFQQVSRQRPFQGTNPGTGQSRGEAWLACGAADQRTAGGKRKNATRCSCCPRRIPAIRYGSPGRFHKRVEVREGRQARTLYGGTTLCVFCSAAGGQGNFGFRIFV